jgi:hypothetical protein
MPEINDNKYIKKKTDGGKGSLMIKCINNTLLRADTQHPNTRPNRDSSPNIIIKTSTTKP